ncbi:hypothetical protein ABZ442_20095 [Streptomyces triculaminicus]|uniref:hypothetical protein n=1 Tax=Streptomyces triculaminicus TaxID=2816232 RepID=UPI0033FF5B3A
MLVATQPCAEIALGLQLRHATTRALANRSTQGYAASDANWSRLLDTAIETARFTRLRDLYDQHHAGETIGYGPGADKIAATFNAVKKAASETTRAAKTGDKRTDGYVHEFRQAVVHRLGRRPDQSGGGVHENGRHPAAGPLPSIVSTHLPIMPSGLTLAVCQRGAPVRHRGRPGGEVDRLPKAVGARARPASTAAVPGGGPPRRW